MWLTFCKNKNRENFFWRVWRCVLLHKGVLSAQHGPAAHCHDLNCINYNARHCLIKSLAKLYASTIVSE